MKQVRASVISNAEVTPGVHLMWLRAPEIAQDARPGQFVLASAGDRYFLSRPISLHLIDDDNVALLVRITGKGTEWFSEQKKGAELDFIGMLGNGFEIKSSDKRLLLVAGGMGIAPVLFLAQEAVSRGLTTTLLYGAPTKKELYPLDELSSGIETIIATDDGTAGQKCLVTDLIPEYINEADAVFACGPLPMYKDMTRRRQKLLKNKPCQISLEMRMACGHGVCYGCTIETKQGLKQVCKDGPVFELDEVEDLLKDDSLCAKWLTV